MRATEAAISGSGSSWTVHRFLCRSADIHKDADDNALKLDTDGRPLTCSGLSEFNDAPNRTPADGGKSKAMTVHTYDGRARTETGRAERVARTEATSSTDGRRMKSVKPNDARPTDW